MSSAAHTSVAGGAYVPRIHLGVVTRVVRLTPGMIRVTLGGRDLHDYPTTGIGDEYIRVFFPDHPDEQVRMPIVSENGWEFPEGIEPAQMRTYTIREHRPGEVDIDFVEHKGGVASAWAAQAQPGQQLAINAPRELYEPPPWAVRQVLVADEPALPAALRIAEITAADIETSIIAEVRAEPFRLEADIDGIRYTWLDGSGNGVAPSGLVAALREAGVGERCYVWVASETRVSRDARGLLRRELTLAKDAYKCIGYWTDHAEEWRERYEALGRDFQVKVDSLYSSSKDEEEIVDEVDRLFESVGL